MPVKIFDKEQNALDVSFVQFSGGERHVQLGEFKDCETYVLRADLRTSDDVFDLLLTADALNQKFGGCELFVEIPYLPYARQDRVCAPGQAFSLKVLAGLLGQIENVKQTAIWDCHSTVGVDLTGAVNVAAEDIIKTNHELSALIMDLNSVVICPDKGAVQRTRDIVHAFEKDFQPDPIVYCEKVRDPATGQITHTNVMVDSLEGRTAIITDDICDGGYTFIKVAEQLKAKGAEKVVLFVTHGIFSKGLDVFDGLIDHVFTTPSFKHTPDPRLTVIHYAFPFFLDQI
ncbi:ribose-phosphate diphosphokinase [Hellea sp.]|nr:ribose-phosphate diphosphokinase [Hellea sp.]